MAAKKKKSNPPLGDPSPALKDAVESTQKESQAEKSAKRLSASKSAGAARRKENAARGVTKSGAPSKKGATKKVDASKKSAAEPSKRGRKSGAGDDRTITDSQVAAIEAAGISKGKRDAAERKLNLSVDEAGVTDPLSISVWEKGSEGRLGLDPVVTGSGLSRQRDPVTEKGKQAAAQEKADRRRAADMSRDKRRSVTREDLKKGNTRVSDTEVTTAVDNDIPSRVQRARDYPGFAVTEQQATTRRDYLFGKGTTPITDDVAPVSGVDIDPYGVKTKGKFLPGTSLDVATLSRLDTPIRQAADEAAQAGEAARALADLAKRIPRSVPDPDKEPVDTFTSGTSTSADVEAGTQPTRGGRLGDVMAQPTPEGGKPASELLGVATRFLARKEGAGGARAVSGAMQGGQFATRAATEGGVVKVPAREGVVGGPKLAPQDAPALEEFANRMEREAPGMPREYDVEAYGPPAITGGIRSGGGLLTGEGYSLRSETNVPSAEVEDVTRQALENKRTTPINSGNPITAPLQEMDTDVDVPESGGSITKKYRGILESINEDIRTNPDAAKQLLPELQPAVDEAMGVSRQRGRVTSTFPRQYSKNNPKNEGLLRPANREGLGVMGSPQTHKIMKAIRQDVGIKGNQSQDEDIRLISENAGITRKIERELMSGPAGVGEGKDTRGAIAGSRKGEQVGETGINPTKKYGKIMLGAGPASGGPEPTSVKVKLKDQDKEGSFVTSQPNIPDVAPTRKNKKGKDEPIPGVLTLPELKVTDPLRGSVFDYVSGAGKVVKTSTNPETGEVLKSETRPDVPGTVRFSKSIGGRDREFATVLSTVKESGTVDIPRALGSREDDSGTYIDPSKAPKVYDYGYETKQTAPAISPETTPGTIVAGAGSVFRSRRGVGDIVGQVSGAGTVGADLPGIAISKGNPIVSDASAAASNPAIQRAAMRPYREGGIRRAKEQARADNLHIRGQQMAAATVRLTDAEKSMRGAQAITGAAASVGGTLIKPGEYPKVPKLAVETPMTTSQVSLRSREGLPTAGRPGKSGVSIMDSATEMSRAIGSLEQAEKQDDPFNSGSRTRAFSAEQARKKQSDVADVLVGRFGSAGIGF